MLDRKKFFDLVRQRPFGGNLHQIQVDGCSVVLDEFERRGMSDIRELAYILATDYHETAHTMNPSIEEYGKGAGHPYGKPNPKTGKVYYGRGPSQITWDFNYQKLGPIVGADLFNHPEMALEPDIAIKILFEGMCNGIFTGRKLSRYITPTMTDFVHARQIVNGMDRAQLIASYANMFLVALKAASTPTPVV